MSRAGGSICQRRSSSSATRAASSRDFIASWICRRGALDGQRSIDLGLGQTFAAATAGEGKTALFLRRWLSREHGESPSPVQAAAWLDIKRHYLQRRPRIQRVYLALNNVTPYAEVASSLDIQTMDEPKVRIGDTSYQSLSLDMGERSVDGWLMRLAAAELGGEQDGLLDERRRALVVDGRATVLTRKEFEVMRYLGGRQGEAVTRIELLNDVWGLKYDVGGNVVDAVVAGLRKKLGDLAWVIETVHGHGYLYRSPAPDFEFVVKVKTSVPRRPERKTKPARISSR